VGCKKFRIYPENKQLRFTVVIHDTKKEMYKENHDLKPDFGAINRPFKIIYKPKKRWVALRSCGEIHFYKNRIGTMTVSPELLHAMLTWARRVGLNFESISVVGRIIKMLIRNYIKHKSPSQFTLWAFGVGRWSRRLHRDFGDGKFMMSLLYA